MPLKKKAPRQDVLRSASGAKAPSPAKAIAAKVATAKAATARPAPRQQVLRSASGARLGAAKALLAKTSAVAAKNAAAGKSLAGKSALKPVAKKIKREPSGVIPTLSAEGMATTMGKTEENASSGVPKNFRNHPDMENFFRFIYENDLRLEALEIIDGIIVNRVNKKSGKKPEVALMMQ